MLQAKAADDSKVADREDVADCAAVVLDSTNILTRPVFDTKTAVGTAMSVVNTTEERGATGAC